MSYSWPSSFSFGLFSESHLQISSRNLIVLCPFFVLRCLSYRSVVSPWRQVVLPQFWLPRRGSLVPPQNTVVGFLGVRFCCYFLWHIFPIGDPFCLGIFHGGSCVCLPAFPFFVVLVNLTTESYPVTLSFLSSSWLRPFLQPLSTPKTSSHTVSFGFLFLSSSSHRRVHVLHSRTRKRESDCDWIMNWVTLLDEWFHRHGALYVSLLPVPMTSWVFIMTYRSDYDFLHFASYTVFPSTDIHVCLPSNRHPFRCYSLHLDTWGSLYTGSYFYSVTTEYYDVYWIFVSRRCMMQPIIFLGSERDHDRTLVGNALRLSTRFPETEGGNLRKY